MKRQSSVQRGNFKITQNLNFRCKPNYCVLFVSKTFTVVEMQFKLVSYVFLLSPLFQRMNRCMPVFLY